MKAVPKPALIHRRLRLTKTPPLKFKIQKAKWSIQVDDADHWHGTRIIAICDGVAGHHILADVNRSDFAPGQAVPQSVNPCKINLVFNPETNPGAHMIAERLLELGLAEPIAEPDA